MTGVRAAAASLPRKSSRSIRCTNRQLTVTTTNTANTPAKLRITESETANVAPIPLTMARGMPI